MIRRKVHILLGSLLLVLMSTSLTFSTLHSHHHIQWHHSEDFTDTGNCITADISICPICGYHLKTDFPDFNYSGSELKFESNLNPEVELAPSKSPRLVNKGRSPPAIA